MGPDAARLTEIWDENAARYDIRTAWLERRFLIPHRRWMGERAGGEVLEVAIGTGANLEYYGHDVRLTGIDWSAGMLGEASKRAHALGRRIRFVRGDAMAMPFSDDVFDTVVCTLSLCGVPDERRALGEAVRVLRPGGRLLLVDHVASHWLGVRAAQRLGDRFTVPSHGEYLTRRPSLLLNDFGIRVVEQERHHAGVVERVHGTK